MLGSLSIGGLETSYVKDSQVQCMGSLGPTARTQNRSLGLTARTQNSLIRSLPLRILGMLLEDHL